MPSVASAQKESKKINLQLSAEVVQALDECAQEASRNRSSIIREALDNFLREREHQKLAELMKEGYEATAKLDLRINAEFEHVDSELAWDY